MICAKNYESVSKFDAFEVFFTVNALYKLLTYLLTYILTRILWPLFPDTVYIPKLMKIG